MKRTAGIWIDREHAILMTITDERHEILKFAVSKPDSFPPSTESRQKHAYIPNDFQPEDRTERKKLAARKQMYDAVTAAIQGVQVLIILGPGEAKKEFAKHIEKMRLKDMRVEIEASDRMTEPQLAAKVRQHFMISH